MVQPKRLSEKAMLVQLSISYWTARKLDREVTERANEDFQAQSDAGRYNKLMLGKQRLQGIQQAVTAARICHYRMTLPWNNEGTRILPSAMFWDYSEQMRKCADQFQAAKAELVANYPAYVAESRKRLGRMFRPEEYPAAGEIGGKFQFSVMTFPLPEAGDFRVDLGDEQVDRIRKEIEQSIKETVGRGTKELWARLHECVAHMAERLGDSEAIFRDSLVENLAELVALLPKLNLADDPELKQMQEHIEKKLLQHTANDLRENKAARRDTAQAAKNMAEKMAGYAGIPLDNQPI